MMESPNGNPVNSGQGPKVGSISDQSNNANDHSSSTTTKSPPTTSNRSKKSVRWSEDLVEERTLPPPGRDSMVNVKDVFGRWRQMVGEATKKAEDLAGNTWQHLKTAPSLTDAALGRIAQGTKVLAEGGYEKIFRQTFDTVPDEQLRNSYACYLSTSAGPVMGVLYVSTVKLAFCSDNPLSYKANDKTEWSYYKVIIPLHQLKAVNPSSNRVNSAEKYIQLISNDGHEFWYMGFINYDGALKCQQNALHSV